MGGGGTKGGATPSRRVHGGNGCATSFTSHGSEQLLAGEQLQLPRSPPAKATRLLCAWASVWLWLGHSRDHRRRATWVPAAPQVLPSYAERYAVTVWLLSTCELRGAAARMRGSLRVLPIASGAEEGVRRAHPDGNGPGVAERIDEAQSPWHAESSEQGGVSNVCDLSPP